MLRNLRDSRKDRTKFGTLYVSGVRVAKITLFGKYVHGKKYEPTFQYKYVIRLTETSDYVHYPEW